jgi:peptidoglycan/xylan/chitin deacetylase (PgdA/CDA1 family)
MYHGLTSASLAVPDACFIPVATFADQMAYIAQYFDVRHLDDVVNGFSTPTAKPIACVTFDDGFASVGELAWPILQKHRIPATVYLVTGLVDSGDTVWFARLHQAIMETSVAELLWRGASLALKTNEQRADASALLQGKIKLLPRGDFDQALASVLEQLEASPTASPRPEFQILKSATIRRMSEEGLVRFGAHTVSHQILTRTTHEDARREIQQSVESVRHLVRAPSGSFAYPNGGHEDFDEHAISALREVGVHCAVSTIPGPFTGLTDRFSIPRYNITHSSLARFARKVHHIGTIARRATALQRK